MFYGRQDRSGAAGTGRARVTVYAARAGGRAGVPPVDAGRTTAQGRHNSADGAGHGACVPALRPDHAPPGYAMCIVAGPVWKASCAGFTFRLPSLPCAVSAPAGPAGRGTGPDQRFSGPAAGAIGSGGPLSAGSPTGVVAFGGGRQRYGRLACGAAFRASGGGLRRGVEPVSYTHLRAHETGRNLVCRLLLEKK